MCIDTSLNHPINTINFIAAYTVDIRTIGLFCLKIALKHPPATLATTTHATQLHNSPMGTLYLVRHAQASFGAANYDQLSDLGHQQAVRLGDYVNSKGLQFDGVLTGTLHRHAQTYAGICQGAGMTMPAVEWKGLNEYDSEAIIKSAHAEPVNLKLGIERNPENYRHYFRLLKTGLSAWMNGSTQPEGMPSYAEFVQGVTSALDHVREQFTANEHSKVLIVSSGGPISTAVGQVLGTSPEATIELNLRIRNTSITEFAFTPKRHMLVSYNTLPHLEELPGWVKYA
jgi:broad specificity phosphatase PhoE